MKSRTPTWECGVRGDRRAKPVARIPHEIDKYPVNRDGLSRESPDKVRLAKKPLSKTTIMPPCEHDEIAAKSKLELASASDSVVPINGKARGDIKFAVG